MIDNQRLSVALKVIHKDDDGRLFYSGRFINLMNNMRIDVALENISLRGLVNHASYIHQDFWNLLTIALRLDWQKGLLAKGELNDILGSQFAACDIDLFHIQYRSLFDHLAKFIGLLSGKPRSMPDSFDRIKNRVDVLHAAGTLDDKLAEVIKSCDWFSDMRNTRNSIVHRDGQTMVFPEEGRILFQVHEGFRNTVNLPETMFNENIVDFELYAGLLVGYLLGYLEEVAEIADSKLEMKRFCGEPTSYHGGLSVVHEWIEKVASS